MGHAGKRRVAAAVASVAVVAAISAAAVDSAAARSDSRSVTVLGAPIAVTTATSNTSVPGHPRFVRVTPSGPFADHQRVRVFGEGFIANATPVSVTECQFQAAASADCGPATLRLTHADAQGRVQLSDYRMRRFFETFQGRRVDCLRMPCSLSVQDLAAVPAFSDGVIIPISFHS